MAPGAHAVTNQSEPWVDVNLFSAHRALQDALCFHGERGDHPALTALGAQAGSAALQEQARLANVHKPVLHTRDRCGRRIDEVEFHPSYHLLMREALHHGLHGTPWSGGSGSHVRRAAGLMLFAELAPSVLCPVTMTYAATPALRANPALHADWSGPLARTVYDARPLPGTGKTSVTLGMGMTEKQGGSDVRANTTRADHDGDTPWGPLYRLIV